MPKSRYLSRAGVTQIAASQGQKVLTFSSKTAEAGGDLDGAFDGSLLLAQFPEVYEIGRPGLSYAASLDASAASTLTVPTGKYWRLIGATLSYLASADAATRTPVLTVTNAADTAFTTISLPTKTANQRETETVLFGTGKRLSGTRGVAAVGTLVIAEPVTAGDTITIDTTVYTFVTTDDGTVTNAIALGGSEANTKAALNARLATNGGSHPTVVGTAFSGDNMVLTAREKGLAGDSIVTTETLTHASNVFDATTLGAVTAGLDFAVGLGDKDFPTLGNLLVPTDKVVMTVTNGHANDEYEFAVFYIEYDRSPIA